MVACRMNQFLCFVDPSASAQQILVLGLTLCPVWFRYRCALFLLRWKPSPQTFWLASFLSFLKILYPGGNTSLFRISGLSHDSFPNTISGSVVSMNVCHLACESWADVIPCPSLPNHMVRLMVQKPRKKRCVPCGRRAIPAACKWIHRYGLKLDICPVPRVDQHCT